MFNEKETYDILTSTTLTHEQKVMSLARKAENGLDVLNIPEKTKAYFESGSINDLFEGHAPYRPRYIMPDYDRFIKNGSQFLQIEPPTDLDELLTSLMILYRHVPSITNFPVFLGNLDKMLEPFLGDHSDEAICKKLKLFLTYLDRTVTDSFCHANIGPEETRAGRLLLKVEKQLQNAVPNFTLKYDHNLTSDAFAEEAINCSLVTANPAICNHLVNKDFYEGDYGISSCYNILPIGGGAYTLTRLTLTKLALEAESLDQFMNDLLPDCISSIADYLNERTSFLVEKSGFFESSFLVKEGLISKDRFVAMFGITGLGECVNTLLQDKGLIYGRDAEADQLANEIMDTVHELVQSKTAIYAPLTEGKFVLHAQVGLESDIGVTSGVRIPIGDEPENFIDHLLHSARYHKYFPSGVGDIFPISTTVEQNPAALLDVVKGAFHQGVHYMSFYAADSDLVRITGYLVKRSEMEKYDKNEVVLQNTTHLGAPTYEMNKLAERKVRMV